MHAIKLSARVLLALSVAATALLCAAQSAQSALVPISQGEVQWGFKQTFRHYVVPGAAHGVLTVSGGIKYCNTTVCDADGVLTHGVTEDVAANAADGFFRIPVASGQYDEATGTLDLKLAGSIHFYGHDGVMNIKMDDIHVILSHDGSVVRVDVTECESCTPTSTPTFTNDHPLVNIGLTGSAPVVDGGVTTWTGLPTTFIGGTYMVQLFRHQYQAGREFDALSFNYTGPGKVPVEATESNVTILESPVSAQVTAGSRTESVGVVFESDAEALPAPSVKWQKRSTNSLTWTDIDGATNKDATLTVTAADSGSSYRAVYTNGTGSRSTEPAQLVVNVQDTVAPRLTLLNPAPGSTTVESSVAVTYTVTDNDAPAPSCTRANGAIVPLKLGPNTITVICVDDHGNQAIASAIVTRVLPAPAAPVVKSGKALTLKLKKGKPVRLSVGEIICAGESTCIYTLPKRISVKIGRKTYPLSVSGPKSLEPGQAQSLNVTLPAAAAKALKASRKSVKLRVKVRVANADGTPHATAKVASRIVR